MPVMYLLCLLGTQTMLTGNAGPGTCSNLKTQVIRFPTATLSSLGMNVDGPPGLFLILS